MNPEVQVSFSVTVSSGYVLVGAGSPQLELGHLRPGEVQHWVAVIVGIGEGDHDFWILVGDAG